MDSANYPESCFLKELFKCLNQRGIHYCVLRNYETLPYSLNGSDLDILVHGNSIDDFYDVFLPVVEKCHGNVISNLKGISPKFCICGKVKEWWGIQVDVFEGVLSYKNISFIDADFILRRSKQYNNIWVANDDDAAIIVLLKEILNNRTCSEKYFLAVQAAYEKNKDIYGSQLEKHFGNDFKVLMLDMLSRTFSGPRIEQLADLGRGKIYRGIDKRFKVWKGQLQKSYRFFNPPGFSVAILGCDGAGKTTVINQIKLPLNEAMHNAFYYEHMRPNLIPNIAQLFGKKKPDGPATKPHGSKPSGLAGSLLRLTYYSFDYIVGYWLKIYPQKVKKSCIWLFDRYYYDYLVDPYRARLGLPEWLIKLGGIVVPAPNLILCLGANPAIIHSRKAELPLREVQRQVERLREFCDKNNRAVWIDTGCSIEKSVDKALEAITSKMAARYEKQTSY